MIDARILDRLRKGVCAVGYLQSPLDQYAKDVEVPGSFTVVGTGFLVREEIVLTNRHVLDELERVVQTKGIPRSQLFLSFIVYRVRGDMKVLVRTPRQIRAMYAVRDRKLDIGLIGFRVVNQEHFEGVEPVDLDDPISVRVSEEVAAFGYPHGNSLLEKEGRVNRWGPVLQQGWVSGIAPYESWGRPEEFLLDLRAAEGISGSPVFRPSTGKVIGVLHSGVRLRTEAGSELLTTTAFAQPISDNTLAGWLAEFELERGSP
jgi:S1-C subfamily serine protease